MSVYTHLFKIVKRKKINNEDEKILLKHGHIKTPCGENLFHAYMKHENVFNKDFAEKLLIACGTDSTNKYNERIYDSVMCHTVKTRVERCLWLREKNCVTVGKNFVGDFLENWVSIYKPKIKGSVPILNKDDVDFLKKNVENGSINVMIRSSWRRILHPVLIFEEPKLLDWFMSTFDFSQTKFIQVDAEMINASPISVDCLDYIIPNNIRLFGLQKLPEHILLCAALVKYSSEFGKCIRLFKLEYPAKKEIWSKLFFTVMECDSDVFAKKLIEHSKNGYIHPEIVNSIPLGLCKGVCYGKNDNVVYQMRSRSRENARFKMFNDGDGHLMVNYVTQFKDVSKNNNFYPSSGSYPSRLTLGEFIKKYDENFGLPSLEEIKKFKDDLIECAVSRYKGAKGVEGVEGVEEVEGVNIPAGSEST